MDGLVLRAEDLGLSDEALERLAQGEPVEITRGGQLFARVQMLSDVFPARMPEEERQRLFREMDEIREQLRRDGHALSQADIRRLRDDHGSDDD